MSSKNATYERATGGDAMLRLVLKLDALVTAVNGVAYLALAGPLHDLFGFPTALQYPVGVFLVGYGAVVMYAATRPAVSAAATRTFIVMNVLWAVASVVILAAGELSATALGGVWAMLQALVVAAFGGLQAYALRRAGRLR